MLEAYTLSQSYDRLLEEHKALQQQLTEKDETITILRKALEIQQKYLMELREVTPYELYQEQITNVLKESNSALGEGDKE